MLRRILFLLAVPFAAVITFSTAAAAAVAPGTFGPDPSSFNPANAPSSSHLANGSPSPQCTVNADLSIGCGAFTLGGVGHTNADVLLTASDSATLHRFHAGTQPNNPAQAP